MRLVDRQQVRTRQDPATDYEVLAARIPQSLRSYLAGVVTPRGTTGIGELAR
jgi:hypothetical protein